MSKLNKNQDKVVTNITKGQISLICKIFLNIEKKFKSWSNNPVINAKVKEK